MMIYMFDDLPDFGKGLGIYEYAIEIITYFLIFV